MGHPTTVTTWQRREHARKAARRAAGNRAAAVTIGAVLAALGGTLAVLGAGYAGGIVAVLGALIVTGAVVS